MRLLKVDFELVLRRPIETAGGYMIVETDKPTDIHYFTSFFAVFEFKVEPVVDVMDAVAAEVAAIEYRKKNFS